MRRRNRCNPHSLMTRHSPTPPHLRIVLRPGRLLLCRVDQITVPRVHLSLKLRPRTNTPKSDTKGRSLRRVSPGPPGMRGRVGLYPVDQKTRVCGNTEREGVSGNRMTETWKYTMEHGVELREDPTGPPLGQDASISSGSG